MMKTTLYQAKLCVCVSINLILPLVVLGSPFTNGSFELPGSLQPRSFIDFFPGDTSLAGWTIGGAPVFQSRLRYANDQGLGFGFPPPMDRAYHISFNSVDGPGGSYISQKFDTLAGRDYAVTFFVGRLGLGPGEVSLTATVSSDTGVQLAAFKAVPPLNGGYGTRQRFLFAANSTSTTLTITDTSLVSKGVDVVLDAVDVSMLTNSGVTPVPEILKQPQDADDVKLGGTATFSVQVRGTGTLRYQWRFNGARIIGATVADHVVQNVSALDEGEYTVEVSDDNGTTSSERARLTIYRDLDGDGRSDNFERGVGRYELVRGSFTWQEAKEDAEKRGGHLATIISQAEWDSMVAVMGNFYNGLSIWIGGTDAISEGSWTWVTGEPWGYTRWAGGEPDNLGDQDYALLIGNGLWNDYAPSLREYYLLERGFYTDPNNADTDGDGFKDGDEYDGGSIPTNPNSRPLPKITFQPQGTNVIVGNSFALAVAANGFSSLLTYQWQKNGTAISNATNSILTFVNGKHEHSGRYDVVVSNRVGPVTSAAAVVRITPVIDIQRLNNGFVVLQLLDIRPLSWRVESSENLETWQNLGTMTYTDGLGVFLDATAVGKSRRFYRVVGP